MGAHITNFEYYSLSGSEPDAQKINFSPNPHHKVGLYFGWRWIFLGWSVDVSDISRKTNRKNKNTEFDLSLYSSKIGLDLFYRNTETGTRYISSRISGGCSSPLLRQVRRPECEYQRAECLLYIQQPQVLLSRSLQPIDQPAPERRLAYRGFLVLQTQTRLRQQSLPRLCAKEHESRYAGDTDRIQQRQFSTSDMLTTGCFAHKLPRLFVAEPVGGI